MSKRIWKAIPFIDIPMEASVNGKIRDKATKNVIQVYRRKSGYEQFSAFVNDRLKTVYVHRCVLAAHKPIEGYDKMDVHHKDHNPSNNKLSNLVWCTTRENALYSLYDGRLEYSKIRASENAKNQLKNGTHAFFNLTEDQHRLKYINRSKNYKANGNHPNKGRFGLNGTNVKLTKEKIIEIKERVSKGEMKTKIAKSMNLNRATIYNVINGVKKYL